MSPWRDMVRDAGLNPDTEEGAQMAAMIEADERRRCEERELERAEEERLANERDCEHGQLRRSCELCELIAENKRLQAVVDAARAFAAAEDRCDAMLDANQFDDKGYGEAIDAMQDAYKTFRKTLRALDGEVKHE